jgi:hypothetical protein
LIFEELNSNNIFINTLIPEMVKIDDDDNNAEKHLDPFTVIVLRIAKKR